MNEYVHIVNTLHKHSDVGHTIMCAIIDYSLIALCSSCRCETDVGLLDMQSEPRINLPCDLNFAMHARQTNIRMRMRRLLLPPTQLFCDRDGAQLL